MVKAGKEMTLLGIPTVIFSPDLVYYPADLNYVGDSPEHYFEQIGQALADGWSAENSRKTFRWLALEESYSRIDISDGHSETEHPSRAFPVRVYRTLRRMINSEYRKEADCRRRPRTLASAKLIEQMISGGKSSILDILKPESFPSSSVEQETRLLRHEFRRLMRALYARPDEPGLAGTLKARIQGFLRSQAKRHGASSGQEHASS